MADSRREEQTRRFLSLVGGRLAHNRWMLAAGAVAVLAVGVAGGVPTMAVAAIPFLVIVAMLAPRRTRSQAARAVVAESRGLDGLSAQSLAAAVSDPLIVFDAAGTAAHVNDAARVAFGAIAPGLSLLMKFRTPEVQSAIERVRTVAATSEVVDYVERVPI